MYQVNAGRGKNGINVDSNPAHCQALHCSMDLHANYVVFFFLLKYCTEYMTWVNRGLSWRVGSVLILQFFFVLIYIIIFFISHSLLSLPFPFSSKIVQSLMYGGSCAETLSKKWENASLCSQEIGFPKRYLAFKRAWLPAMDNRTHGIRQVVNVVVPRPKV